MSQYKINHERLNDLEAKISKLEENNKLIEDYLGMNNPLSSNKDIKQEIIGLREEQEAFIEVCQMPCSDCKLNEITRILIVMGEALVGEMDLYDEDSNNVKKSIQILKDFKEKSEKSVPKSEEAICKTDKEFTEEKSSADSKLPEPKSICLKCNKHYLFHTGKEGQWICPTEPILSDKFTDISMWEIAEFWILTYPEDIFMTKPEIIIKIRNLFKELLKLRKK